MTTSFWLGLALVAASGAPDAVSTVERAPSPTAAGAALW